MRVEYPDRSLFNKGAAAPFRFCWLYTFNEYILPRYKSGLRPPCPIAYRQFMNLSKQCRPLHTGGLLLVK